MQEKAQLNDAIMVSENIELPKTLRKFRDLPAVEILKESFKAEIRLKDELQAVKDVRNKILDDMGLVPQVQYFTQCNGEYLVFYKIKYSDVDVDKLKKSDFYKRILNENLERDDVASLIKIGLPEVEFYIKQHPKTSFKIEDVLRDVSFYRVQTVKELKP